MQKSSLKLFSGARSRACFLRISAFCAHFSQQTPVFNRYIKRLIFPISASFLSHIDDYRKVLESYSRPLLDFIDWKETKDHNIDVRNNTIDYYRYFDATLQAEFLYDCVKDTIENIIPAEVSYLRKFDEFKRFLDDDFEMLDKMVALLVEKIEGIYQEIHKNQN